MVCSCKVALEALVGLGMNAILYFSVSEDDDFWMMFLVDFELTRGRLRDIIPKIIDGLQLIDVC